MQLMIPAVRAVVYEVAIGVVIVLGLPLLAIALAPDRGLLPEPVQPVGFALTAAGGGLWLWASWVLVQCGDGTPLPLDPPRRLVTTGPYRYVRNPMHMGLIVFLLGEGLVFRSTAAVALVGAGALGLALYVRREEAGLGDRFGAEYDRWAAGVGRWLPRCGRLGS